MDFYRIASRVAGKVSPVIEEYLVGHDRTIYTRWGADPEDDSIIPITVNFTEIKRLDGTDEGDVVDATVRLTCIHPNAVFNDATIRLYGRWTRSGECKTKVISGWIGPNDTGYLDYLSIHLNALLSEGPNLEDVDLALNPMVFQAEILDSHENPDEDIDPKTVH